MSNQATAEYYWLISKQANERLRGWDIAESVIIGVNFGNIEYFARNGLWTEAGEYLAAKACAAERACTDFPACVLNIMHRMYDRFSPTSCGFPSSAIRRASRIACR